MIVSVTVERPRPSALRDSRLSTVRCARPLSGTRIGRWVTRDELNWLRCTSVVITAMLSRSGAVGYRPPSSSSRNNYRSSRLNAVDIETDVVAVAMDIAGHDSHIGFPPAAEKVFELLDLT